MKQKAQIGGKFPEGFYFACRGDIITTERVCFLRRPSEIQIRFFVFSCFSLALVGACSQRGCFFASFIGRGFLYGKGVNALEKFVVQGGASLRGEVTIGGAKNAVVAIIPATVLAKDRCVIENIPNISDVTNLFHILEGMGATIRILNKTTVEIDTTHLVEPTVTYEMARQMRASYYFLGSLLGRCNEASVSMPGGCDFGVRPIDQHIKGFEALGANVTIDGGMINAKADLLLGSHIYFDVVSVGATINVMLAASQSQGPHHPGKCGQRTPHCGLGQLPQLHGGRYPGRWHRCHQNPWGGYPPRHYLFHHPGPD